MCRSMARCSEHERQDRNRAPPSYRAGKVPRHAVPTPKDRVSAEGSAPDDQADCSPPGEGTRSSRRDRAHLVVGPVGAGKSTFATRLAAEHAVLRLTLDRWTTELFHPDRPLAGDILIWYCERAARCVKRIAGVTENLAGIGVDAVLEIGLIRRAERAQFYGAAPPPTWIRPTLRGSACQTRRSRGVGPRRRDGRSRRSTSRAGAAGNLEFPRRRGGQSPASVAGGLEFPRQRAARSLAAFHFPRRRGGRSRIPASEAGGREFPRQRGRRSRILPPARRAVAGGVVASRAGAAGGLALARQR